VNSKDEQELDIIAIHSHLPLDDPLSIYHMGPTWLLPTGLQAQHVPKEARHVCTYVIVPMWHQLDEWIYKHFDLHELKWTNIDSIRFAKGKKEPGPFFFWVGIMPRTLSQ